MANEKSSPAAELDDLAFQIYTQAVSNSPARRDGEREARESYRLAATFLTVRTLHREGKLKPKEEDMILSDCSAPNLRRTHPHNLVSQRFGNLEKVNRIKKWLDANPTPETDPNALTDRLNQTFPDLGWDMPTVNVARAIFPTYCTAK